MSSWANRNIPRKRDLSQIPSEFRSPIIARSEQLQVKQSELLQQPFSSTTSSNEIIYPQSSSKSKNQIPIQQLQMSILKSIEKSPSSAFNLTHNNMSYVFVILRQLQTAIDNNYWISSYNSIRKFYTNKIIIIDDNSMINTVNGNLVNTEVIKSNFNGAGEILAYYYFYQNKWADCMIFLQDTMILQRPFESRELDGSVHFHWHFIDSDVIDKYNKLMLFVSSLKNNSELVEDITTSTRPWKGCFSATSIIHYSVIEILQNKYEIFTIFLLMIQNMKDRELFERLLGKILCVENFVDEDSCSNFGNITMYPDSFQPKSIESSIQTYHQHQYSSAIIKCWK
jgi:hypothetical protein